MSKVPKEPSFDAVLVGGGLQNALVALALVDARPETTIALVERGERLGGKHTWCFHADDVPAGARTFVEPLIEHRWVGYDVVFPDFLRSLDSPYAGFSSERLHQVLEERFAERSSCELLMRAEAAEVGEQRVVLADGRSLRGRLVVDSRGPQVAPHRGSAGYQKFVGQELELASPHGLNRPVVMDATVPQRDGFRFFYVLPLGPQRILVEDTRFSDTPVLDRDALRAEITAHAAARGFEVANVVREEEGVLPMPWAGRGPAPARGPLLGGYRGGWLHPATGYSFPIAVRLAALVARTGVEEVFGPALAAMARRQRRQARFGRALNRLLFRWFLPEDRRHVFARFYRLPEPTIRRFYAHRTTARDRLRILIGRPPRGFSLRARLTVAERLHEPTRF